MGGQENKYANLILRFQCYSVELGMLCHLEVFVVRSFLRSKPGRGAQRQVSVMCGLLMCDVLGVHILQYVTLYDHKI
jgi:hypothetical protein